MSCKPNPASRQPESYRQFVGAQTDGKADGFPDDASTPSVPQEQSKPRLRCFLVEDSPVIRQNLISTLEEMLPVEVIATAEEECEAVQWMRRCDRGCDLMIIDIVLRTGTGLEVLRQARRLQPNATLVVLSNYATRDIRQRCLGLGADRIFDKSAEVEELLAYGEQLAREKLN